MIYLINDFDGKKSKTVHIAPNVNDVMIYLSDINNLKKIKGEIKIVKVVL